MSYSLDKKPFTMDVFLSYCHIMYKITHVYIKTRGYNNGRFCSQTDIIYANTFFFVLHNARSHVNVIRGSYYIISILSRLKVKIILINVDDTYSYVVHAKLYIWIFWLWKCFGFIDACVKNAKMKYNKIK